jgi:hypothetical protein
MIQYIQLFTNWSALSDLIQRIHKTQSAGKRDIFNQTMSHLNVLYETK